MGLASAYGTIRSHKGFMEVFSRPAKGTTITIYLPATETKAVKPAEVSQALHEGTGTIILHTKLSQS